MSKLRCPFCKSENLEYLPTNDAIHKNYVIERNQGMMSSMETGSYYYPIIKAICLECGNVFQKMSDENLKKYHQEKPYFAN